MDKLKDLLEKFHKAKGLTEDDKLKDLDCQFKGIAESLFFGGYFLCGEDRIFPKELEFYYNEEGTNDSTLIKDPVMFHTIDRTEDKSLPYFTLGQLHVHDWGVDLTFENSDELYRASVLIKSFVIAHNDEVPVYEHNNVQSSKKLCDYIRYDLNAFGQDDKSVKWVDSPHTINDRKMDDPKNRINVAKAPSSLRLWRYNLIYKAKSVEA